MCGCKSWPKFSFPIGYMLYSFVHFWSRQILYFCVQMNLNCLPNTKRCRSRYCCLLEISIELCVIFRHENMYAIRVIWSHISFRQFHWLSPAAEADKLSFDKFASSFWMYSEEDLPQRIRRCIWAPMPRKVNIYSVFHFPFDTVLFDYWSSCNAASLCSIYREGIEVKLPWANSRTALKTVVVFTSPSFWTLDCSFM